MDLIIAIEIAIAATGVVLIPIITFSAKIWSKVSSLTGRADKIEETIKDILKKIDDDLVEKEEFKNLLEKTNQHVDVDGREVIERLARMETTLEFIAERLNRIERNGRDKGD